jgi:hypothetical protein
MSEIKAAIIIQRHKQSLSVTGNNVKAFTHCLLQMKLLLMACICTAL